MENRNEDMIREEQKEYKEPEISAVHYDEEVIVTSDPWETQMM